MNLTRSKKKDLLYVAVAAFFFLTACVLQTVDDYISDWSVKTTIALLTQYIFFGLLAYWTASVISRISDKSICSGIIVAIALMGGILFVRLLKYHVFYDGTVMRYLWYSYYIPHCLAPAVLLITLLGMGRKDGKPLAKGWYLLFLPAAALILLVFTNDLHEQVFSFAKGLKYSNEIYKWEWGYYFILSWIAVLYLSIGVLLYIKCRVSGCRKKAWIPLVLFIVCIVLCVLREVFDPVFIRMPEAVVFSVVVVFESLIRIGFIPSNVNHEELFYVADVSAGIADKDLNVVLTSKNAPEITREQAMKAANGSKTELREDLVLRAKAIRGGEVFWTEDYSVINKINESLAEINETLAARVKVHDGMGSLILKTKRALLQGEGDKEALIREWNGVVSFVSSPETEEDRAEEIKKTAESVGVKILYTGVRPPKGSVAEKILANAVFECITNTARHADGDELYITVSDEGAFFTARIGNNGRPPKAEIVEGGGLSSLRRITEMAGGSMKTESFPRFLLSVSIPKGEKEDER